ncbi:MAG: CHASE3 domain-containing protein [Granulosicoccus sp.]
MAENLQSAMIDMETGLHGYLISGDSVLLEPYDSGQSAFEATLARALDHVSDNPDSWKDWIASQT